MTHEDALLRAVCRKGLGITPAEMPARERERQVRSIRRMLADYEPVQIWMAIQYGMSGVWPYDGGQPWDAVALEKNVLKAVAVASRAARRNEIPTEAARLPDPDEWEG